MNGITPPPAIVARTRISSSSSPRIASCRCRGVIRFTRRSFDALPGYQSYISTKRRHDTRVRRTCQLEHFGREVLQNRTRIYRSFRTDPHVMLRALFQITMNTTDRELEHVSMREREEKGQVKWGIPEGRLFDSAFVSCGALPSRRNLRRHPGQVHLTLTFRLSLWGALLRDGDCKK
jgi:hypothetical protein